MKSKKNLSQILEDISKRYGNTAITTLGAKPEKINSIPSPSIALNNALGVGGFPKGKIIEIFGQESVGKTTLCAQIIAEAQKQGGICAYIDVENAVDEKYFNDLGVITNSEAGNFLLSQASTGEEALTIIEYLLDADEISVIVVDSVAALVPEAVLNGEIEDQTIGQLARLLSKALPRLNAKVSKSMACLIFINQLRSNIGVFGYGPKTVTTGGKSLPYYANVRIELVKMGQIKNGEDVIGNKIKAKIIKNKVAPPFKEADYELIFGEGISQNRELLDLATKYNLIKKGGAWFNYTSDAGEEIKHQGIEKFIIYLKDNPQIKEEIYNKIKEVNNNE